MAVSMRTNVAASRCAARTQTRAVVCHAHSEGRVAAAAALAAAALISATPAQAGVVLEQPQLKKVFQGDSTPAAPVERPFRIPGAKSAPSTTAAAKPAEKKESEPVGEFGIDPRAVALPASIVTIAAVGAAISKIDAGFNDWINDSGALVRNSAAYAGFETDIKEGAVRAGTQKRGGTQKVGTKKISKK